MATPAGLAATTTGSEGFGIHLGSSAACVAFTKDGRVDVVANDLGDRTTPCFVAFTEHDMPVGFAAKQGYVRNTRNTIYHVKQLLGISYPHDTIKQFMNKKQVRVLVRKEDIAFEVDFKGKLTVFTVPEILEILFKKLLEIGQSKAGKGCFDAVLAVPVNFTSDQENLLRQIASKAGVRVLRIIHEPAAAALAYDVQQEESTSSGHVLVFRLGGVSCDVTVIKLCGGVYSIVANVSDYNLGGDNFTEVLLQHLQTEFKKQSRQDISDNSRSIAKLQRGAEMCKHALSTVNNSHCSVESLYDGMDFSTSVSRARFESLCTSLKNRCISKIEDVLSNANLEKCNIEKVILCGGGSKVPLVQKMVSDTFPNAGILNHIPPDEVIAIGAAKEASILQIFKDKLIPESEHQTKIKILSQAIGVKIRENQDKNTCKDFQTVFSKSTPIPSHQKFVFTASSQERAFFLDVLELDDYPERGDNNENGDKLLASVVMKNIAQESPISTSFILTREKLLEVICREESTQKKLTVQIPVR